MYEKKTYFSICEKHTLFFIYVKKVRAHERHFFSWTPCPAHWSSVWLKLKRFGGFHRGIACFGKTGGCRE